MSTLTNLLAYWRMDEASGNRLDSVGSFRLEPSGTVNQVAGKLGGGAVEMPNGASFLAAAGTRAADFSNAVMSMAGWLRIDTSTGSGSTAVFQLDVDNGSGANVRELTLLFNETSGVLEMNTRDVDTDTDITVAASTFGALSVGTWYHVAIVWNGSTAKLFVNTTEDSGSAKSMFSSRRMQSLLFGYAISSTFEISLDEWGVWDEELSATDISDLYNSGSGAVPPGLGYPGGGQVAFFGFH